MKKFDMGNVAIIIIHIILTLPKTKYELINDNWNIKNKKYKNKKKIK